MRAPPPAQEHPSTLPPLTSPNSLSLQAVGLVMVGLRRAEAELQTALPNPQGSGLFHSHSASQALNHFPLHYKKTFVFLHPHPLPLKKLSWALIISARGCVCVSVKSAPWCHPYKHTQTVTPAMHIPPPVFPILPMPKRHSHDSRFINTDTECLQLMDTSLCNSEPVNQQKRQTQCWQ